MVGDLQRVAAACLSISAVAFTAGRMRISATSWEIIRKKWLMKSTTELAGLFRSDL